MFLASLMLPLSPLLGSPMSVRRDIVQFRGALVVFVMWAIVVARWHSLECLDFARFIVSLFGHFECVIGVFERSFRMPLGRVSFALFVVLGGRPVCLRRALVLFGSLPMILVHDVPRRLLCTAQTNLSL
jgi:hypothetical protein